MTILGVCVAVACAEPKVQIENVTNSPRGTFRVEQERKPDDKGNWATTFWISSASDPDQRVRLDDTSDDPNNWHFFISPDEQWICATVHEHSQLNSLKLYRRKTGLQFDRAATMDAQEEGDEWHFDKEDRSQQKATTKRMKPGECTIILLRGVQTRRAC